MATTVLTREEAKQSPQEKKPRSNKLPLGTEELKKLDAYWRAAKSTVWL
jgi:hypothetical protein